MPRTSSPSCDQAVFVDQASGVGLPSDAVPVEIDLCVPRTLSMSCDQVIFVYQATDASLSLDAVPHKIGGFG